MKENILGQKFLQRNSDVVLDVGVSHFAIRSAESGDEYAELSSTPSEVGGRVLERDLSSSSTDFTEAILSVFCPASLATELRAALVQGDGSFRNQEELRRRRILRYT